MTIFISRVPFEVSCYLLFEVVFVYGCAAVVVS